MNNFLFKEKNNSSSFSADINDKVTEELQKLKTDGALTNWTAKVLGGGRINHDPDAKSLKVYGYSQVSNNEHHAKEQTK